MCGLFSYSEASLLCCGAWKSARGHAPFAFCFSERLLAAVKFANFGRLLCSIRYLSSTGVRVRPRSSGKREGEREGPRSSASARLRAETQGAAIPRGHIRPPAARSGVTIDDLHHIVRSLIAPLPPRFVAWDPGYPPRHVCVAERRLFLTYLLSIESTHHAAHTHHAHTHESPHNTFTVRVSSFK